MDSQEDPGSRQRETFLVVLLGFLTVGGGLVLMVGLMGMFVIHALTVMAMLVGIGFFHYFMWGRSLSQEVAGEREEEEGFRALDDPPDESIQPRKY